VLVDANEHVDREAAARSGVGFYGKNTMLITRRFGSWVVLGTLVTTAEVESTAPLDAGCGSCTLCIDACPTDALDEPGVLDATRCLSYWTQSSAPFPEEYREALEDRVYGCDICQDVCPWNRGVEKGRGRRRRPARSHMFPSLTGSRRATRSSRRATTGCSCRATTRATCAATRWWHSGTPAATRRRRTRTQRATSRSCASTLSGLSRKWGSPSDRGRAPARD